jgi:hypothetical protein
MHRRSEQHAQNQELPVSINCTKPMAAPAATPPTQHI